jgi:hypothetical protein
MTYYTTLNKIREHRPCQDGWEKLLRNLGKTQADDEPISIIAILESNGIDDALWCLRAFDDVDKDARLFAVWCARQVQHLMTDPRSIAAIDVAERYVNCDANGAELSAAWAAANAAASSAANAAASSAAWAAASDAARAAAWDAANAAGWDVESDAASSAAWAAARAAAWAAAWDAQESEFRQRFWGNDSASIQVKGTK